MNAAFKQTSIPPINISHRSSYLHLVTEIESPKSTPSFHSADKSSPEWDTTLIQSKGHDVDDHSLLESCFLASPKLVEEDLHLLPIPPLDSYSPELCESLLLSRSPSASGFSSSDTLSSSRGNSGEAVSQCQPEDSCNASTKADATCQQSIYLDWRNTKAQEEEDLVHCLDSFLLQYDIGSNHNMLQCSEDLDSLLTALPLKHHSGEICVTSGSLIEKEPSIDPDFCMDELEYLVTPTHDSQQKAPERIMGDSSDVPNIVITDHHCQTLLQGTNKAMELQGGQPTTTQIDSQENEIQVKKRSLDGSTNEDGMQRNCTLDMKGKKRPFCFVTPSLMLCSHLDTTADPQTELLKSGYDPFQTSPVAHSLTAWSFKTEEFQNHHIQNLEGLKPLPSKIRRRQGTATDPQSIAARTRRERFSDRIRILQSIVPNGDRLDTVSMLGQTLEYVRFLQHQVWELYHGVEPSSLTSMKCEKWKDFIQVHSATIS